VRNKVNYYLLLFLPNKSNAMKCSELLRLLKKAGWVEVSQKGSHVKMKHDTIPETIIFPNHGSQEIGKGLEMKIKKIAGL
jgi:predicted RNA binding protein YcfA (HicA-like mRNA interferase family)